MIVAVITRQYSCRPRVLGGGQLAKAARRDRGWYLARAVGIHARPPQLRQALLSNDGGVTVTLEAAMAAS